MIESPEIQEIIEGATRGTLQGSVLRALEARFGAAPPEISSQVRAAVDEQRLDALFLRARHCPDLAAFRAALSS
jgi:hypothetical protein